MKTILETLRFDARLVAVSVKEAAQRAGVSERFLREAAQRGDVRIRRAGNRKIVAIEDLRRWILTLPADEAA